MGLLLMFADLDVFSHLGVIIPIQVVQTKYKRCEDDEKYGDEFKYILYN